MAAMAEVRVYDLDDEAWRKLKAVAALQGRSANDLVKEILTKASEELWQKSNTLRNK